MTTDQYLSLVVALAFASLPVGAAYLLIKAPRENRARYMAFVWVAIAIAALYATPALRAFGVLEGSAWL